VENLLSKVCLEHIVNGMNCSSNANLKVVENQDGIFIINEKDSNDIKNKLHLKIEDDGNEFKISLSNYNTQLEDEYKELFNKSLLFTSKVVNKVFEFVISDDKLCTSVSMLTDVICRFIKMQVIKK